MSGISTSSKNEVTNISAIGFWVIINDKEFFIAFSEYPMFKTMPAQDIFDFQLLSPNQLYWEKYDIDIELSALKEPESFPLVFK